MEQNLTWPDSKQSSKMHRATASRIRYRSLAPTAAAAGLLAALGTALGAAAAGRALALLLLALPKAGPEQETAGESRSKKQWG